MVQIPATKNGKLAWMEDVDRPVTQGMTHWQQMTVEGKAQLTPGAVEWLDGQIAMLALPDESRAGRLSPSSLNTCHRRQMLVYSGAQPVFGERAHVLMAMGRWSHLRWQSAGLSEGFLVDAEVFVRVKGDARIRGSMDGIVADGSGFELKTTSDRNFTWVRVKGPSHDYLVQVHAYMYLGGLDAFSLVYESRETGEFFETRIRMDNEWRDTVVEMIDAMIDHMDRYDAAGVLPPVKPMCAKGSGKEYQGCPLRSICLPSVPVDDHDRIGGAT